MLKTTSRVQHLSAFITTVFFLLVRKLVIILYVSGCEKRGNVNLEQKIIFFSYVDHKILFNKGFIKIKVVKTDILGPSYGW